MPQVYSVPGEPWSIWFGNAKIQRKFSSTIYNLIHAQEAQEYWSSKLQISLYTFRSVDWDTIEDAMKSTHWSRSIWVSKYLGYVWGR
jgi:hypothetical protein